MFEDKITILFFYARNSKALIVLPLSLLIYFRESLLLTNLDSLNSTNLMTKVISKKLKVTKIWYYLNSMSNFKENMGKVGFSAL